MVRKKVRTQFLLFKNPTKQTKSNKPRNNQTNKHKYGREKGKSPILLKKKIT